MLKYKHIPGYCGLYIACSDGSIISERTGKPLKPGVSQGYHIVVLTNKAGIRKTCKVHRLICATFKKNPKKLPVVAHGDDNPLNNAIDNLKWATQSKNMQDCYKRGRAKIPVLNGEKNHKAKLTEYDVRAIRSSPEAPHIFYSVFYGVGVQAIKNIINRKTWKHVN